MSLLPVAEAQARILALASPRPVEHAPLADCTGRWLAADLAALRDQPWADLSAMDGYAIRTTEAPGPWRLSGGSAAGDGAPAPLAPGTTQRIFTGAPVPPGADAILIQENAGVEDDRVTASTGTLRPGLHIRPKSSDFAAGSRLLPAGTRLGPAQIALAALGGHDALPVHARPRVAILSTGNELVPAGAPTPPGALPSSNAVMLAAMLAALPCTVVDLGIARDDLAATSALIAQAQDCDILVTTGGASVGDHDLVRPAFTALGGALDFWKVAMRPGKPLMAGALGDTTFLGLPGNPVSAFATAFLFLLPLVRRMGGAADCLPRITRAIARSDLPATGDRDDYLRAFRSDDGVVSVTSQDSAATAALAQADCFILRPAGSPACPAGTPVDVLPFAF